MFSGPGVIVRVVEKPEYRRLGTSGEVRMTREFDVS